MVAVGGALLCRPLAVPAQARSPTPFIRWADLEVDPLQLDRFRAAANVHAQAVRRFEAGVLAFHVVAEAGDPGRVRVFEMYDDAAAYRAHLQQPHFRRFVAETQTMLTGRQLYDVMPVRLGAKPRLPAAALVRIAELAIDPAQLQAYVAAVSEEIDDSIRLEPGVLTIYAVALADKRHHLRFFEIYADQAAYRQHIESPHFMKYLQATKAMIRSRRLFETGPVFLLPQASMRPPTA